MKRPGAHEVAKLARFTVLATLGLIVLGGVVRSTGSGLARVFDTNCCKSGLRTAS